MNNTYSIAAKRPQYGSYTFDSQLELKWFSFFEQSKAAFTYQPELDLYYWLPDFFWNDFFIEVKPTKTIWNKCSKQKARILRISHEMPVLLLVGQPQSYKGYVIQSGTEIDVRFAIHCKKLVLVKHNGKRKYHILNSKRKTPLSGKACNFTLLKSYGKSACNLAQMY